MILLIDNYDSFTFNIYHYLSEQGARIKVYRNDKISISQILKLNPQAIVLSPGPCTPNEAGICLNLVKNLYQKYSILGICLGHQSIGEAFGSKVIQHNEICHGKVSKIYHDNKSKLYKNIPRVFKATRYHSLIINKNNINANLLINAWLNDGSIMGIEHVKYPLYGVQYHPESIETDYGKILIKNFITNIKLL